MCGIAGIMSLDGRPPDEKVLDGLIRSLAHRGPDGDSRYASGDTGMVQTRLAIIDLQTGDQPFYEPGRAALVANGEIYNYIELRDGLDGIAFSTQSDCEPPLHLYRRHGLKFAEHLRGMYAIAIHDPVEARLVLSRDPFGIKPLYYAETPHGFAFASEPQALLANDIVAPQVAAKPCMELLQLQFTTGRDTIYEGIKRVLPGETLVVAGGRIIERRRVGALPDGGPQSLSEAEALERLEAVLTDSVTIHQRSDVPYGLFLSGGVDSATLLAMMARLNSRPVRAFTVGFANADIHDERQHARMLARQLGADHVEVDFGERDFWALLPKVAAVVDDPAADYAILPTYKLAQTASQELKVVLCGEGGDELFAGYGRYRSAMRPFLLGGRAMRRKGTFDGLRVLRDEPRGWRDGIVAAESMADMPRRSRLQIAQAVDCADWLPHDLLIKLDRCLMANGMEGRTPFLDVAVAELAYRLPDDMKIRKGRGKYLLRRWLDRALPQADAFSRKKGFTVPVGQWIAGQGERLGPLVAGQPGVAEICRPGGVERLFREAKDKREGFACWSLLYFALWHRANIQRLPAGDTVFDTLAAG